MKNVSERIKAARRVQTPIVGVLCPDQKATLADLAVSLEKAGPLLAWDRVRAMRALNPAATPVLKAMCKMPGMDGTSMVDADPRVVLGNPTEMLDIVRRKTPEDTVVFLENAQYVSMEPDVSQAMLNLRDEFKSTGRLLILLAPTLSFPAEVQNDVVIIEEAMPDESRLAEITRATYEAGGAEEPASTVVEKAVSALAGLANYPAEQACALAWDVKERRLDHESLWRNKRQAIEQTPGLSVWKGGERFEDIGGCENVKEFMGRLGRGRNPARAIVFIDEI